jgi:hypothetical protein
MMVSETASIEPLPEDEIDGLLRTDPWPVVTITR